MPSRSPISRGLLILDLDGTLVDSFADIRYGVTCALAELGVPVSDDVLALSTTGRPLVEFYRVATGRDPTAAEHASEVARFVDCYRRSYFENPEPGQVYPEVTDTLARLRGRHPELAVAVATTKRTAMAERLVERAGLTDYLDRVQGSEGRPPKPDPAILLECADTLGRAISDAVMVGDTRHDIAAARAAGCRAAIGVIWGGGGRGLAAAGPDHLIERFSQLEELI